MRRARTASLKLAARRCTAASLNHVARRGTTASLALVLAGLSSCIPLSGCLVAGYSSEGGWWIWPGSLVITLLILLLMFLRNRH